MPVTPARNNASLTSGSRSGRTIVVMSFMGPEANPRGSVVKNHLCRPCTILTARGPGRHAQVQSVAQSLLGALVDGWTHTTGGATETMANLTASIFYYPRVSSGFFLTGGAGFSDYRVNTAPSITGTGWGFTAGAGYDLRVGPELSLTPVATYGWGSIGDLSYSDGVFYTSGWKQNFLDFSLSLTFH